MMGLGKPQLHAKVEVNGFIKTEIQGNFLKTEIKQKLGNPLFWEKLSLTLVSQTQWGDFTKNCILRWKILNFGVWSGGVKIFFTKVPKGT